MLKIVPYSLKVILLISAPMYCNCSAADVSRLTGLCNTHPLADKISAKSNCGEIASDFKTPQQQQQQQLSLKKVNLSWLFSGIFLALEISLAWHRIAFVRGYQIRSSRAAARLRCCSYPQPSP